MKKLKILLIDDDRDIADTLAFIIRRSGYDVSVAYDGEAAVKLAGEQSFDFAFIDIMLPGMDGADCLVQMHKINRDLKAYMMTGYSAREYKDKALQAGALDILHKPVMPEDLLGRLCQTNPGTILIADDDPIFAEVVSTTLQTAGWGVRTAETGLQAVDILSRGGIDAMVLDIAMPVLNGVEVCAELKRRGIVVPIIVATSAEDGRQKFCDYRVQDFLQKPVDPRAILNFVERFTGRPHQAA